MKKKQKRIAFVLMQMIVLTMLLATPVVSTQIHRTQDAHAAEWTSNSFYPSQGENATCGSMIDMASAIGFYENLYGRVRLFNGTTEHGEIHDYVPPNEDALNDYQGPGVWGEVTWATGNYVIVWFDSANWGQNGDIADFEFTTY
ncbi:MAG: hypothetical protein P9L92_00085 [Candidatus Electryonea clarkiae]|nr:hypothetical protein [Candidatus Electryonea clarkiae]